MTTRPVTRNTAPPSFVHNVVPGGTPGQALHNAQRPPAIDCRTKTAGTAHAAGRQWSEDVQNAVAYREQCVKIATALIASGAMDSRLTVNDLALLGLSRLRELQAKPPALDEFAGYSINVAGDLPRGY